MSNSEIAPALQPPGRGLPKIELWVARLMVGWRARRTSRAQAAALFARERAEILRLVRLDDEASLRRRVLIDRLRGLEDSSRYWSVLMTLDHLRIVNEGTTDLIAGLVRGERPARVVGTADVKPSPAVETGVIDAFARACDRFENTVAGIGDLHSTLRWPHPWFGPLDAGRWHFFTAFHMGLHRRQVEAIRTVVASRAANEESPLRCGPTQQA